jgi:integrase
VYESSVREFLDIVRKLTAEDIKTTDMDRYLREMRLRKRSKRTIHNRFNHVLSFLAYCGLNKKTIAPLRPKYEKQVAKAYTHEELIAFFAAIEDDKLYNTFQILLCAGLREQEAKYLLWSDIDLVRGIVKVRSKPQYGFAIKDKEERDVPIPQSLIARLREYRASHPAEKLVTGTKKDQPSSKLLWNLKRIVHVAGLGCNHCDGCSSRQDEQGITVVSKCHHWFLHKFRATAITTWHRSGMDMRTIMSLSGHSDLETIMRYLAPRRVEELHDQIDTIQWM